MIKTKPKRGGEPMYMEVCRDLLERTLAMNLKNSSIAS